MLHANMKRMTHSNNREFANASPLYLTDRDMFRRFGLHLPRARSLDRVFLSQYRAAAMESALGKQTTERFLPSAPSEMQGNFDDSLPEDPQSQAHGRKTPIAPGNLRDQIDR
jgi:hypothetical protein